MIFLTKYLMDNADNTIFEPLDFKIFWGRMPPAPSLQTRASGARFQAPPPPLSWKYAPPSLLSEKHFWG